MAVRAFRRILDDERVAFLDPVTQALDFAESMGMTPRSRARLRLDLGRAAQSFDLARHWQEQSDG
ncbi:MAG TPA: hypothetical protein VHY83_13990 [Solirubrobacteraceae bacterium]|jgi:hypothetical protein|nr:hypothetical protein [Solirubrobacteraceae bacterium]